MTSIMKNDASVSISVGPSQGKSALPPNNGMELTGRKRHSLC
jgi:hypothetical protein